VIGLLFIRPDRLWLDKNILYNLKFVYNFIQIFLCGYMTLESLKIKMKYNLSLVFFFSHEQCAMYDPTNSALKDIVWLFYISKILDFADTFFLLSVARLTNFLSCIFIIIHSFS